MKRLKLQVHSVSGGKFVVSDERDIVFLYDDNQLHYGKRENWNPYFDNESQANKAMNIYNETR